MEIAVFGLVHVGYCSSRFSATMIKTNGKDPRNLTRAICSERIDP